jgi:hypothetical protein
MEYSLIFSYDEEEYIKNNRYFPEIKMEESSSESIVFFELRGETWSVTHSICIKGSDENFRKLLKIIDGFKDDTGPRIIEALNETLPEGVSKGTSIQR